MSDATPRPKRILSGIQPSGQLHLGNYFGAIRQHIEQQDGDRTVYFIADLHALTSVHSAELLQQHVRDVAATYLALGLDPDRCIFFRQSAVPEVCELMWMLLTATAKGELERATSYKDKVARGLPASAGLFTYPALMAADIVAYDTDLVPVGKDQVQHLEMTREMARAFHTQYGREVFRLPEAQLSSTPVVPGIDGAKMSKSYGNHIPIMLGGKALKKLVGRIETDSRTVEEPKDPDTCKVFALYALFATDEEKTALAARYRAGNFGYGESKAMLVEKIEARFGEARAKYEALMRDPAALDALLETGAKKARAIVREVLARARAACGLA